MSNTQCFTQSCGNALLQLLHLVVETKYEYFPMKYTSWYSVMTFSMLRLTFPLNIFCCFLIGIDPQICVV